MGVRVVTNDAEAVAERVGWCGGDEWFGCWVRRVEGKGGYVGGAEGLWLGEALIVGAVDGRGNEMTGKVGLASVVEVGVGVGSIAGLSSVGGGELGEERGKDVVGFGKKG